MKKIVLINPKSPESFWSLQGLCELNRRAATTPPLGLATLAAITPPAYEIQIVDEAVQPICYDIPCDLVGITGYTVHKSRMIEISGEFRSRGILTVAGGPYCSAHPEESQEFFDIVVAGEAEYIWPLILQDWENGSHKAFYKEKKTINVQESPPPRWDLVDPNQYLCGMVQTSRGCPYDCEFCDVVSLFGRKTRYKAIPQVLNEIENLANRGVPEIFFADDNFIGHPKYAKELLEQLILFNQNLKKPIRFMTQVTLNCAADNRLLDLFKRANFFSLFVGIETPKRESLIIANKRHNMKGDMIASVQKIQSKGIVVVPGMIVGFDTDDIGIFKIQEEFILKSGLLCPMIGVLMAPRGTKLWKRLESENRLMENEYGDMFLSTNFDPKLMSRDELETNYLTLLKTLYSAGHFTRRYRNFLEQVNLEELQDSSAVTQLLSIRKSYFFYTVAGIRILFGFLFSSTEDRKLLFQVLKITLLKSPKCLPLGLYSLAYFRAIRDFAQRHFNGYKRMPKVRLPSYDVERKRPSASTFDKQLQEV